ncbi:MAG: 16S rRNA (guanine(527)-N(7))-methyltransferase RsmG [Bacteroidia bacterium]
MKQLNQLAMLEGLFKNANEKINLVSRKDIDNLMERHILHSLAIAKFIAFKKNTRVLDFGTGGGLPGIPLAIFFPDVQFTLCDSIEKKIRAAKEISINLGLKNIKFITGRVEQLNEKQGGQKVHFDFILSRAVASVAQTYRWTQDYISKINTNAIPNGYLFLKGGDLREEISEVKKINKRMHAEEIPLSKWFGENFFETKKLLYVH